MDKYTVDLDKVLNDFEYSELTDQYSVNTTSHLNNVHPSSSTQRQQDLYKFRNTPIKHTITNVFQSLNEYLNTDININKQCDFSTDGGTVKELPQGNLSAQSNSIAENTDSAFYTNGNVGNQHNEDKCILNFIAETQQEPCVSIAENAYISTSLQNEQSNPSIQVEPEVSVILPETSYGDKSKIEHTTVVESVPELKDVEIAEEIPVVCESTSGTEVYQSELSSNETVGDSQDNVERLQPTSACNFETNKNSIAESSVNVKIIDVNMPIKDLTEKNTSQVIGFDSSFGIDDTTLHQYLDELENEFESKCNKTVGEDDNTTKVLSVENKVETKCTDVEVIITKSTESLSEDGDIQETDSNAEDNNTSSRPSTLEINSATQIDLIGEPGSTPYNNMYVSKTLPETEVKHESDTESSPSASPTFSDVSTESNATTASTESVTDSIDDKVASKLLDSATLGNSFNDGNSISVTKEVFNDSLENTANNNTNNSEYEIANENTDVSNLTINQTNSNSDTGDTQRTEQETNDVNSVVENVELIGNQGDIPPEQNSGPSNWLGKQAPLWIPDSEALNCMHCDTKFTVIKRRHHCRACGLVLCSKCCNMKYKLEYLDAEARVCLKCYDILNKDTNSSSESEISPSSGNSPNRQLNQPNPNNPMEYCSMVPPFQQVSGVGQNPPTVMVPVGVLKRKGSAKSRTNKSVMFCDGIRPGSELTNLDNDFNYNESRSSNSKKGTSPPPPKLNRNAPICDPVTKSFIPNAENSLPPTVTVFKSDISYAECPNNGSIVEMLKNEPLTFALQSNLHVYVKIINMDCCINKWAWCFSTEGMISVGQDEIVLLLEYVDKEKNVPKDIFLHLNNIYNDAKKGCSITENGISLHGTTNFLESKNHMGFLYIRPTFQCLQNVIIPKEPYLIGILIHRWEMPWAKIFPLRLILRLGAEYRYYPSPIISTRHRESVFVEIGHTIINLLADFRNFSYTLPSIRGLTIHMEEKNTTVTIPLNRYDQVLKSLNNSSDHILAFGGNFSVKADSHLVCIQDTHGNNENNYTTHAINIHNRPRKVTGASFIVFNGALKSSSGLTAKSSIVEDGLMIQIPPEHMVQIRESLRNMKNHTVQCGCINAASDETVNIVWGENDVNFNTGVQSAIDNQSLTGVPSIRVHNGKDYVCNSGSRMIRWTEVFILQNGDDNARGQDVDFSKLAEGISKATCQALVKYLDLLSSNNFYKIGIRTTLHVENVSYSAGSNGMKLPPIYMKSLDNELIPVLHRITSNNLGESAIVLELVFRILNV